jgi:hypothetical protein
MSALRSAAVAMLFVLGCRGEPRREAQPPARTALLRELRNDPPIRAAQAFALEPWITPAGADRHVLRARDLAVVFSPRGFDLTLSNEGRSTSSHVRLIGANAVSPIAERPLRATVASFVGDRATWSIEKPCGQLAWEDVYPGVDMVVRPSQAGFDYRFLLAPGADLHRIAMEWSGARAIRAVDGGRALEVDTGVGILRVGGLKAFAIEGSLRRELPARHVVDGTTTSLVVDGWSGDTPLLIDPSVAWGSFVSEDSIGYGVATDGSGNVIVAGYTRRPFPEPLFETDGGFQPAFGGGTFDAFVAKTSGSGELLWASYIGGDDDDYANAVTTDASGNVLVTGRTQSTNFPTKTPFGPTFGGGEIDAFVAKISGAGALLWSSYLGGSGADFGYGVTTDATGAVYVTGETASSNFPSSGGFDATLGGAKDAFVTKISSSGSIVWSSFLGGTGSETGRAVAASSSGVFVVGSTQSSDFPSSGGSGATFGGGTDAFVTKVTGAGAIAWSSYLGGSSVDEANGVAVDAAGNAFVVGATASSDFPSAGGFDATLGGTRDGFVAKIGGTGTLAWSSYLGGADGDVANAAATDAAGNVFLTGSTSSTDFPLVSAFLPAGSVYGGTAFVVKLASAGTIGWSSLLSSVGNSEGFGIATDPAGHAFVTGVAYTSAFTVSGGFDTKFKYYYDAFVVRVGEPSPLGTACVSKYDCASGFCVDGVCCDKACAAPCEACSASKKGSGTDGICGPVAADTDPKDACAVGTTGPCAADGTCDGAGKCRSFARAGVSCGASSCASGVVSENVCKGDSETCVAATRACAPYRCGATTCTTTCTSDGECDDAAYCAAPSCVPKAKKGAACTEARACLSGFCVDGVCCDGKCDGQCESCNGDAPGSCLAVLGPAPAGREKCAGAGTMCGGRCDGVNGASCRFPIGVECSATCVDAAQTIGVCDESGGCKLSPPEDCSGFACDGSHCRTSCTSPADCVSGFTCEAGQCTPAAARCSDDGLSVIAGDGKSVSCGVTRCRAGKCIDLCTVSDDCAPGYLCASGTCAAATPEDAGGCALSARSSPRLSVLGVAALLALALRRRAGK